MEIRVAGIVQDSIVDGPGMRLTVFTQGCTHACPGCHNPDSHALSGGSLYDTEDLLEMLRNNPLQSGLTLSGGEPFLQAKACAALARGAHDLHKNVWTYTGYTFEELQSQGKPEWLALLEATDVLVDGPFLLEQRSLDLSFRGSRNQRLLDVRKSLEAGAPVAYTPPQW